MHFHDLTANAWAFAALGAFLIGLGKGGLPGAGNVTIWIFAEVFGAKDSVGILLPVLICADVVAISIYRRHAEWHLVRRLFGVMAVGVLFGWALFDVIPAAEFSLVIGVMLLLMTALHFGRRWMLREHEGEDPVPHTRWFVWGTGLAGGMATMLANAAGPVAAFYLMAVRLPKYAFIGTSAWLFFLINLFKMPFQAASKNVTLGTLQISLALGAVAALGCLVAPILVKHIPQKGFETLVWVVIVFAGLRMIF